MPSVIFFLFIYCRVRLRSGTARDPNRSARFATNCRVRINPSATDSFRGLVATAATISSLCNELQQINKLTHERHMQYTKNSLHSEIINYAVYTLQLRQKNALCHGLRDTDRGYAGDRPLSIDEGMAGGWPCRATDARRPGYGILYSIALRGPWPRARPSKRQLGKQRASTRAGDEDVPSPVHKRRDSGCS